MHARTHTYTLHTPVDVLLISKCALPMIGYDDGPGIFHNKKSPRIKW